MLSAGAAHRPAGLIDRPCKMRRWGRTPRSTRQKSTPGIDGGRSRPPSAVEDDGVASGVNCYAPRGTRARHGGGTRTCDGHRRAPARAVVTDRRPAGVHRHAEGDRRAGDRYQRVGRGIGHDRTGPRRAVEGERPAGVVDRHAECRCRARHSIQRVPDVDVLRGAYVPPRWTTADPSSPVATHEAVIRQEMSVSGIPKAIVLDAVHPVPT